MSRDTTVGRSTAPLVRLDLENVHGDAQLLGLDEDAQGEVELGGYLRAVLVVLVEVDTALDGFQRVSGELEDAIPCAAAHSGSCVWAKDQATGLAAVRRAACGQQLPLQRPSGALPVARATTVGVPSLNNPNLPALSNASTRKGCARSVISTTQTPT